MTYSTPAHVRAAIVDRIGLIPLQRTPEAFHRYLDQWAATALEAADTAAALAETLIHNGDVDNGARVLCEAQEFMAEFKHIDSMRIRPVLGPES